LIRQNGGGLRSSPPNIVRRNQIPATQEEDDFEFEWDSVRSNSSRSKRIRLQDKYRLIDEKLAEFFTQTGHKDWIKKRFKLWLNPGIPATSSLIPRMVASRKFRVEFIFIF
jgi:hypothetical protein